MTTDAKTQICRDDFFLMLQNAMLQAGGTSDIGSLKKMTLEGVVNVVAQNGIRMVYIPERHMDAIKVAWETPKKPTGRREDGPLGRRLLLDAERGKATYVDEDDGSDLREGNRG